MQKFAGLIVLLLISRLSPAQEFSLNQGGADQPNFFIVLPYEINAGKIIVQAEINAKQFRFLFDTGSPVVLSRQLYEALKPSIIKNVALRDQSGKKDSTGLVILENIALGGIPFKNIPTLISDNPFVFSCLKVDGIIGSNLLRNTTVQFSSAAKTITITTINDKLKLNKKQSSPLFLDPNQSTPVITLTLKNTKNNKKVSEQLIFDTGDDTFYTLALKHFKLFQRFVIFDTLAQGYGSNSYGFNGVADDTVDYRLAVANITINGAEFENTRLNTTMDTNSRVGAMLLDYGIVTLDYKNKIFYFEPFAKKSDLKKATAEFNVSPSFSDGKLVIGIIWDPLLKNEVQRGDEVVAINGLSTSEISICDMLIRQTPFSHENKLTVTVKNKSGAFKDIQIVKE